MKWGQTFGHSNILPLSVVFYQFLFAKRYTNCMNNKAVYLTLLLERADHKMLGKLTQCQRHFTCSLFCTYVFCATFFCLQFGFVMFSQKNISVKTVHSTLVKLTRIYRNYFFLFMQWLFSSITFSSNRWHLILTRTNLTLF